MLHHILSKCGIYFAKRRYMPRGIEWLWDLQRLNVGGSAPTVVDVGANEGQTTRSILKAFPRATIHAFEPVGKTFNTLQQTFSSLMNVHCNRLAASDSCSSANMVVTSSSQLNYLVPVSAAAPVGARVEQVVTTTLDLYCEAKGIRHIDIIKTDTEGHDLQVLRGAEQTLRRGSVNWVLAEVTFDPLDASHSQFNLIYDLLSRCGFEVYCFYDHFFIDSGYHMLFCNALFVLKGHSAEANQSIPRSHD